MPSDNSSYSLQLIICIMLCFLLKRTYPFIAGVLTQGQLDNGRGRARLNMFRHLHEIQTGRTSSISHEILGFDTAGNSIDYSTCSTAEEICENATKLVTFIDLAGHQRYLRTTLSGLTGYSPHYVMLVVSANAGVVAMTQEHLGYAVALEVPFFIILTKVDVTPKAKLQNTLDSLQKVLTNLGSKKVPLIVKSSDDIFSAVSNTPKENVVPIFCVSSVSGSGIDQLKRFLHLLPPRSGLKEQEKLEQAHPEFQIDEIFDVPNVGCVVGGLVTQGIITEGMTLNLGPFEDGTYKPVAVTSIKRNRAACRLVRATQSAALAIDVSIMIVRKGMVLLDPRLAEGQATMCFQVKLTRKSPMKRKLLLTLLSFRRASTCCTTPPLFKKGSGRQFTLVISVRRLSSSPLLPSPT